MLLPLIPEIPQERSYLNEFRGLNRHDRIGEGEFYDICNMSNDEFPALVTRKKRRIDPAGAYEEIAAIEAIGDDLYVLGAKDGDDGLFMYVNGVKKTNDPMPTPEDNGSDADTFERQTVVNGLWILIWPDKVYYDTNGNTWHSMERQWCGSTFTTERVDELYETSAQGEYTKITAPNDSSGDSLSSYHIYDTIELSFTFRDGGINREGSGKATVLSSGVDPVTHHPYVILSSADENALSLGVYGDIVNGDWPGEEGVDPIYTDYSLTIIRPVPDMDFITTHENRIYGARFARENDTTISEVYVSSAIDIFDFCVGQSYLGSSFTIGETGAFTGIASLGSNVYAFKRSCAVRIGGSGTGLYTQTVHVPGVAEGAHRSLAEHEGYLYYKGDAGVYRFNGEYAQLISDAWGDRRYSGGVGEFLGDRYYLSVRREPEEDELGGLATAVGYSRENHNVANVAAWIANLLQRLAENAKALYASCAFPTFVYDAHSDIWQIAGLEPYAFMCSSAGSLYLSQRAGAVECQKNGIRNEEPVFAWSEEDDFDWWCEFGAQGYETPDEKYVSRILIRMRLEPGTVVHVKMQYDNETSWDTAAVIEDAGIRTVVVPVIPRRCDVYRMRIEGHGACRIYGVTKTLEGGSDIQWHI